MYNISVSIDKSKKNNIAIGSLTATDWLNNIKENKIIIRGEEKNIISSTKLLSELHKLGYIDKLSKDKGYISKEKYLKKKYFEDLPYDIKDEEGKIKKTTYTIYITRKGQRKLLGIVLNLIKEKNTKTTNPSKRN